LENLHRCAKRKRRSARDRQQIVFGGADRNRLAWTGSLAQNRQQGAHLRCEIANQTSAPETPAIKNPAQITTGVVARRRVRACWRRLSEAPAREGGSRGKLRRAAERRERPTRSAIKMVAELAPVVAATRASRRGSGTSSMDPKTPPSSVEIRIVEVLITPSICGSFSLSAPQWGHSPQ